MEDDRARDARGADVIVDYLGELRRELRARGIRGQLCARILSECAEHLRSDAEAVEHFGNAPDVANEFAAELGTQAAQRASVGAFAALGFAGLVYAVSFGSLQFAHSPSPLDAPVLGSLAFATIVIAPQVAFVAGVLALARSVRRRRERSLPSRELAVINRRTGIALGSGLAAMGALSLFGFASRAEIAGWWLVLTYSATAIATVLLIAAAVPAVAAARFRPVIAGEAGDILDDLGTTRLGSDPWRVARRVSLLAAALVWLAGVVQGDPLDGLIRGVFEGLACFGGFALLGRFLGLRR